MYTSLKEVAGDPGALSAAFPGNSDHEWLPHFSWPSGHTRHLVLHQQQQTRVLRVPSLWSQLGDSSSALLSTSVALGLTPCAFGAQADELTTSSWPVLPGG